MSKKSATKQELQSLVGKLQHAKKFVKPGRCFTMATYELVAIQEKARDQIILKREFKADLAWRSILHQKDTL